MNSKGCQGTTSIASALLFGMGEFATSRLYERDCRNVVLLILVDSCAFFLPPFNKKDHTVTYVQHSTYASMYAHTRGLRVRSSLWLTLISYM